MSKNVIFFKILSFILLSNLFQGLAFTAMSYTKASHKFENTQGNCYANAAIQCLSKISYFKDNVGKNSGTYWNSLNPILTVMNGKESSDLLSATELVTNLYLTIKPSSLDAFLVALLKKLVSEKVTNIGKCIYYFNYMSQSRLLYTAAIDEDESFYGNTIKWRSIDTKYLLPVQLKTNLKIIDFDAHILLVPMFNIIVVFTQGNVKTHLNDTQFKIKMSNFLREIWRLYMSKSHSIKNPTFTLKGCTAYLQGEDSGHSIAFVKHLDGQWTLHNDEMYWPLNNTHLIQYLYEDLQEWVDLLKREAFSYGAIDALFFDIGDNQQDDIDFMSYPIQHSIYNKTGKNLSVEISIGGKFVKTGVKQGNYICCNRTEAKRISIIQPLNTNMINVFTRLAGEPVSLKIFMDGKLQLINVFFDSELNQNQKKYLTIVENGNHLDVEWQ